MGTGLITGTLSPRDVQIVQFLGLLTIGVFIGLRFLPARFRQSAGYTLTVCYVAGLAMFALYLLIR